LKPQQTIGRAVELEGRGLFTGEPTIVRFRPAEPNTGLWFLHADPNHPVRIPARVDLVTKRARRTSLQNGSVAIETVEHCLSACAGMGIDNLEIELTGHELPVLDGSCLPYVKLIKDAGIEPQSATRDPYVISEVTRVADGDMELVALPPLTDDADTLEVLYELDYGSESPIGRQVCAFSCRPDDFVNHIAPARTFVLKAEAEALRSSGLGKHLTYKDVVVFGEDGPIDNPLRFPDECVRHKVLDLIGDLMLLGRFIIGRGPCPAERTRAESRPGAGPARSRGRRPAPPPGPGHARAGHPSRAAYPAPPLPLSDGGPDRRNRWDSAGGGDQKRHHQRGVFPGHYPGQPIMPGVLIIEAMAQLGGILLSQNLEHTGKVAVLFSLDKVKFRRSVTPGDQLILEAETIRARANLGHVRATARVGRDLAAQAEIKFMLADAHQD
jgi:UDP-3-O-[3-hydroxymyristoyl] N-acetylglucosamine deacetylase/3-hydroxyacyl-[acyl-carrier-protein] dehydratase